MSLPTVSVIMAEYNTNLEHLRAAVSSILNQTFTDFEFIIVNDGSKNDLQGIAKEFDDSRIRIINNKHNMGFVYSLNCAIKHARGKYLIRMDTDDIAHTDRFAKQLAFIEAHPEYDVVGSRAIEFSDDRERGIIGKQGEKSQRDIIGGNYIVHPSVIMKKKTIVDIGGYPNRKRAEDLALWCELLLAGSRIYVMDDILLHYRVNPGDYKKRTIRYRKGEINTRLFYYPKLGATPFEYIRVVKSILAGIAPIWLIRLYRNTRNKNDK